MCLVEVLLKKWKWMESDVLLVAETHLNVIVGVFVDHADQDSGETDSQREMRMGICLYRVDRGRRLRS
jgi:hypothetical protein